MAVTMTIYSLGNSYVLSQALTAVGELTGAGDFKTMLYIAAVIGVVFIVLQSFRGGMTGIDFRHLVVTWLVYGVFSATTVTVNVEQVYGTGTYATYQASKVPWGLAFMGNVVSLIGYELNSLTSQAFSASNGGNQQISSTSFMADLNTLEGVKINTIGISGLGSANSVNGADVYTSWFNYFRTCTLPGISSGAIPVSTIMNSTDFMNAVALSVTTSEVLINTTGTWTSVTCSSGWSTLSAFTTATFLPAFYNELLPAIPAAFGGSAWVPGDVGGALGDFNLNQDGPTFITNSVLFGIFNQAVQQDADSSDRFSYATMINDAIGNENSQLLAGQSLFYNYVSPALAVIECLVYSLFPMVLLAMMFGASPLGLLSSYGKFVIWTQLWLPALAIIQFVEIFTIYNTVGYDQTDGLSFLTYAGSVNLDNMLTSQMGIIGMLASSVPVICWGIVAAGGAVASSIGGQLGSTGAVKSDVASPREVGQQFSGTSYSALRTGDPTSGVRTTGSEAALPSFQYGTSSSDSVTSAASSKISAMNEFRQAASQSTSQTSGVDDRAGEGMSVRQSMATTSGQAWSEARDRMGSLTQQISKATGMSEEDVQMMGMQMAATASTQATIGTPGESMIGSGASATVSASATGTAATNSSKTGSVSQRTEAARMLSDAFRNDNSLRDDLSSSTAKDIATNKDRSAFYSTSSRGEESLQSAAAQVVSADRSFSEARSSSSDEGTRTSIGAQAAVERVRSNPEALETLSRASTEMGIGGQVQEFVAAHSDLAKDFGGREGLQIMGQMAVLSGLSGGAPAGSAEDVMRKNAFNGVMAMTEPFDAPSASASRTNASLASSPVMAEVDAPSGNAARLELPQGGVDGEGRVSGESGRSLGRGITPDSASAAGGEATGDGDGARDVFDAAQRVIGETNVGAVFKGNVAADEGRAATTLVAPVADQVSEFDSTVGQSQRSLGTNEEVVGAAGHVAALAGDPSGYAAAARTKGLTDRQADLYGAYAAGRLVPGSDNLVTQENTVRHEAGPRGGEIVDRIKAAAYDPGSVNSDRRLADIGEFNRHFGQGSGYGLVGKPGGEEPDGDKR